MVRVPIGRIYCGEHCTGKIIFGSLELFFCYYSINGILLVHSGEPSCVGVMWWFSSAFRLTDCAQQYASRIPQRLQMLKNWTAWHCTRTLRNTLGLQVSLKIAFNLLIASIFLKQTCRAPLVRLQRFKFEFLISHLQKVENKIRKENSFYCR